MKKKRILHLRKMSIVNLNKLSMHGGNTTAFPVTPPTIDDKTCDGKGGLTPNGCSVTTVTEPQSLDNDDGCTALNGIR